MLEVRHSFNGGEWSPRLYRRADLGKYVSACKRLENFIPLPMGGVHSRPGMQYIAAAKSGSVASRLLRFSYSTSTNFILEMGNLYCRFYSNGAQVESGGSPVEVVTPYATADLDRVHYLQIKDVVYFCHPSYTPQKLTRVSDTSWTWEAVAFSDWPFQDENTDTTLTITPSATTGAGITLTASSALFTADHVGSRFRITHRRDSSTSEVSEDITATGAGATIQGRGEWTFKTTETWEATVELEQSLDNGSTWETLRIFKSESDRNFEIQGSVDTTCLLRANVTAWTSQTGGARAIIEFADPWIHGVAEITAFASSTSVTADVETDLAATTATDYWAAGAWSTEDGFPGSIALHESRLWFGGTETQPLTFWGSVISDFETFILGTADDDGVAFTIASSSDNRIAWMESYANSLFIGTTGGEYLAQSRNDNAVLSATNVRVEPQSRYGSAAIQPARLNDSLLFVQRVARVVRDLTYVFERDSYSGNDVSLLAEHLLRAGVTQLAYSQSPWSILWGITSDGDLLGLTYERTQDVIGWHRHTTTGTIESIAVIPGSPNDELWMVVKRTINGSDVRHVERLHPDTDDSAWNENPEDCMYLDAGILVTRGSPGTAVTGLSHLEGETVTILTDGATHPTKVVSSGAITLDWNATKVMVGLPYIPVVEVLPVVRPVQAGSSLGRQARLHRSDIAVDKSLGLELSVHGADAADANWHRVYFRDQTDAMDSAPDLFSGLKDTTLGSRYSREITLALRQPDPLPLSILAVTIEWDTSENP